MRNLKYNEAIREAQKQMMELDDSVFIFGEGVDDAGGIFGTSLDLAKYFGEERVFDIPLSENCLTGIGIGAALSGMKPIMVHQRMDFLLLAMDQIINHAAKWRYMLGGEGEIPLVIRSIIGRGWGEACQHTQSLQALFMHVPGLKVIMPSNPYDAKGLLISAIKDRNPVIFIEHKKLRDLEQEVPEEIYEVPIGKGKIVRGGRDVTIVATSLMVQESLAAADELEKEGIKIEIIDPRTLVPLDKDLIIESVKKTGRLIVADTGWITCGFCSEVSAIIAEDAFDYLKSQIKRIGLKHVPTPSSSILEKEYYPSPEDIILAVKSLLKR
ncbi:alpha-ketoacid dehydrogenase subunit beta [Candidatus Woesearchaeota archaeon]|nr:alpha-ketoacid dehydrogenase subunit beta [Candidatus Woesearchaeota archaeon]